MSQINAKVQNLNTQKDVLIKCNWKYLILFILLIGFFCHSAQYINKDFWHDEAFQFLYSQKDWSYIIKPNDVHPPLFNMVAKYIILIIKNNDYDLPDFIMARLSIIWFGLFFIISFYFIISKIFNNDIGFYSTALLVMSPTYAYFSIEFRSYILVLLLMVWQIYFFWKYYQTEKLKYVLLFTLLSTVCLWMHYYSILILFAELLFLLKYNREKFKHYSVLFSFYWVVIFCITLYYIIIQMGKISSFWFKDIDFISLISTPFYIIAPPLDTFSIFQFLILGLSLTGLIYGVYKKDKRIIYFVFLLVIPIISVWLFSQIFAFYHHRYFLFGGIGLFVGAGYIIEKFDRIKKDIGLFILALILILFLIDFPLKWENVSDNIDTELRDSSIFMLGHTILNPEMPIIHETTFSQSPYKVYLPYSKHYLLTNLTREQLFTAGGSVVEDDEIIRETPDNYYLISANIYENKNIIYSEGGLHIYEK